MKKILFLIHDLGQGGAEKVLINLVNNMDPSKFDISVTALFGGGVNERFLAPHIHYRTVFRKMIRGNRIFLKTFSPKRLYRWVIKEKYDIVVSYLEGITARVVSGCVDDETKLVSWIHVEQHTMGNLKRSFRSEKEARSCYNRFHQTVCVSEYVKQDFCSILDFKKPCTVLYNTVESEKILTLSAEAAPEIAENQVLRMIAVGTLKESKGYDKLLRIVKRLISEKQRVHLYVLGIGPLEQWIREYIDKNELHKHVTLLGYHTNPYKFVKNCDLFVCASHAEGFSTAATEALIVGTPVCTVEVSGMNEMLGENNEYGIVTENSEEALYEGIKGLLEGPDKLQHYREKAAERGKRFSTKETVAAVEEMLLSL